MKRIVSIFILTFFFGGIQQIIAQEGEASPFDFGKMWTFEHAPLDYFEKTYGFRPTEEWLEKARLSSLRFSGYCSASFISPDGLILTNYHCSEGEVGKIMEEGEDLDATGFYAEKRSEERRVPGLFVKQLVKIEDITNLVKSKTVAASSEEDFNQKQKDALASAIANYENKEAWKGLELETVTFYNGGKYSLYGYKKFDDVRLVLLPEMQLGFYGGDPDNFTYPRYNLDFTMWRVYENDKPVNSSDYYFPVNPDGLEEGTNVFLIGNPGSTERYRTVAQLEFDRDYRYEIFVNKLSNRYKILEDIYAETPSEGLQSQMLSYSNSIKALGGILEGMKNPDLMNKKIAMEKEIRSKSPAVKSGNDYWQKLEDEMISLAPFVAENSLLSPSPLGGSAMITAHLVAAYKKAKESGADADNIEVISSKLKATAAKLGDPIEEKYLAVLLAEMKQYGQADDKYIGKVLGGRSPERAAKEMLEKTKFTDKKKLNKLLEGKTKKLGKSKDPILLMANTLVPKYQEAKAKFDANKGTRNALSEKVGGEIFKTYGLTIPPDATFTLRIADGVVKRYNYNGTVAPYKTTYFGLFDRHYSNNGAFPWSLPERWTKNPSIELMKQPINFISTCDSIGGNSGSPMINQKGEIIGLLFDGNIQSLPGNFIYDATNNRSVGVHLGGIVASMKYVFGADKLIKELGL